MVVYSTFGAGDSFNGGNSFEVAGSGGGQRYFAEAMAFTPSATVTLDTIRFVANSFVGQFSVDAVLTQDASGAPGNALETFSSITLLATAAILTETSTLHPTLNAGTTYWLELRPHDPTTTLVGGWNLSSPPVSGTRPFRNDPSGTWQSSTVTQAAFDIAGAATATATPEPASLTLLAIGAVGLLGYGWRQRKQAAA
jgi:hypothetical protein